VWPEEKNVWPEEKNVWPEEKNVWPEEKNVWPEEKNVWPEEKNVWPEEKRLKLYCIKILIIVVDDMGCECGTNRIEAKIHTRFWWRNLKEIYYLSALGIDEIIILKWMLIEY
jgi:hypothetical protein